MVERYRLSVLSKYSTVAAPFLAETTLTMRDVYVPLSVARNGSPDRSEDGAEVIRHIDRAVVIGDPGSGKSMLLKHTMLAWAARGMRGGALPVLVSLRRHSDPALTLERHIEEQFSDGLEAGAMFVRRALRRGRLTVLLDGLDEVPTARRAEVSHMVCDFVGRYRGCQIIVTCRTAVFENQLAPEVAFTFRVLDFDERLIRRFLKCWPGPVGLGRIEELMQALREAPRVMQLARNPLLLTMIAYLYGTGDADRLRRLPHSRAAFYHEATDLLLRRLKRDTTRYPAQAKKRVLRELARSGFENNADSADRLAVSYRRAGDEIFGLLSELGLDASEIDPLIDEIVERSGLLQAVDGGDSYVFAPLSLQEFLAAQSFLERPADLWSAYQRDPTRWRESVKLWCGLAEHDCSGMVLGIFDRDPELAFECVSEARRVNDESAQRVLAAMKLRPRRPTGAPALSPRSASPHRTRVRSGGRSSIT